MHQRRVLSIVRRILWLLVLLLAAAVAVRHLVVVRSASASLPPADPYTGTALDRPAPGFTLTDQFGRRVSLSSLRGKPVVLAFIDSRCTTVCPLTASSLIDAQKLLGRAASRVALVAVNVNPAATTVADVRAWSRAHGMEHRWLFLTGPVAKLRPVWRAYGISTVETPQGLDHTDAIYLIGPEGHERRYVEASGNPGRVQSQARNLALHVAALLPGDPPLAPVSLPTGTGLPGQAGAFALPGLKQAQVRVGQGGTTTLVAFFATWCHACHRDLAMLRSYAPLAEARGLPPVVAVDLRVAEPSTRAVARLVDTERLSFPVALDVHGQVADAYGVSELPELALVSPSGRILWRHVGVMSLSDLVRHVEAIAR